LTDITPGERRELRSVVRQQFKVLRTEVKQREAELDAESERMIAERYRKVDGARDEIQRFYERLRRSMVDQFRVFVDELNANHGTDFRVGEDYRGNPTIRGDDNRVQERKALKAGLAEQVKTAALALDRQEADLLRTLAADALESEEARSWLARIPSVAELVPSKRLREIESQFDAAS
jgi:hypothetical protein